MTTRKKANEKKYAVYRKSKKDSVCDFCNFNADDSRVLKEYDNFWIIKNMFGYDIWDNMKVIEHLMIVPKKHTESINTLDSKALAEYGKIIAEYDKKGYSFYARAAENISKSVPHQHTHLLKFDGKRKKISIFIEKPYILWFR